MTRDELIRVYTELEHRWLRYAVHAKSLSDKTRHMEEAHHYATLRRELLRTRVRSPKRAP